MNRLGAQDYSQKESICVGSKKESMKCSFEDASPISLSIILQTDSCEMKSV